MTERVFKELYQNVMSRLGLKISYSLTYAKGWKIEKVGKGSGIEYSTVSFFIFGVFVNNPKYVQFDLTMKKYAIL